MIKDRCDFREPNGFENCVYNYFCQCYNQCINLDKEFGVKQEICTEILSDNDILNPSYYDELINNAINYFKDSSLLFKSGTKYYIILDDNSKVKLTWENIKSINVDETRQLFWLLRKLVVDSILKKLLRQYSLKRDDIQIYSVGSTKLTSDYDITLYGDTHIKVKIIKLFQKNFKRYFQEDSSIIFDTNVYGKAYITFNEREYKGYTDKAICGQVFYYLKENPSQHSQLMWGVIKYLRDFKYAFGEYMYNDLMKFMNNKMSNSKLLNYAHKTLIYLVNQDLNHVNYTSLLQKEKSFINTYDDDELLGIHDFMSVLNFYGTETYFTRGAFIDTVVNTQMCSNKIEIPLSEVDYITSILENAGFFFIHHNKTKYIIRVLNTCKLLMRKFNQYINIEEKFNILENQLKELETTVVKDSNVEIDYDSKYCRDWANINKDDMNLLDCQRFNLFNIIMNLVYNILKIYLSSQDTINIPFYRNYVVKSSSDFRSVEVLSSSDTGSPPPIFNLAQESYSLSKLTKQDL